ncbi:hypothetical protein EASAB2608_00229 [Streptomyces sp. EAS-AB2608]|nr:hypothetical protein EASAB2608_00229 [Streptomyces sp. EAS-AB2608]
MLDLSTRAAADAGPPHRPAGCRLARTRGSAGRGRRRIGPTYLLDAATQTGWIAPFVRCAECGRTSGAADGDERPKRRRHGTRRRNASVHMGRRGPRVPGTHEGYSCRGVPGSRGRLGAVKEAS